MSEIPKGYKQTEVGVIPVDWDIKPFHLLAHIERGKFTARPRNDPKYYGGEIPFIQTGDVTNSNGYITTYSQTLNQDGLKVSKLFPKGTLFFTIAANIGDIGFSAFDTACPDSLVAITPTKGINKRWLAYELKKRKSSFENLATHNAQLNINLEKLKPYLLPVPSKAEQEAIATALSDTDALIQSLEKLIAKKRLIKQGAMQELLTGKRRLPGFKVKSGYKMTEVGVIPEDWEIRELCEITSLITNGFVGTIKSHYVDFDEGVLYIQGYNVEENSFNFNGIKRVTNDFHRQHQKSCLKEGDLLTIQTGEVGLTTIVPKELEGTNCHALIITRFNNQSAYSKFFSFYFNSFHGRARLKEIETGSTMKHINVGDLVNFIVPFPTKAEQEAIATILSDMDAEISALETKLAKYKQIKQGMMQNLLTGRIRLMK